MSYSLFILHGSVSNIILYKRVFSMFHCLSSPGVFLVADVVIMIRLAFIFMSV